MVLVVYWCRHVYIDTLSRQFDGDARHFLLRLRTAAAHESGVLKGGLPAIVVYVLATAPARTSARPPRTPSTSPSSCWPGSATWARTVRGCGVARMVLEIAGAASFGVLIVIAKSLLH